MGKVSIKNIKYDPTIYYLQETHFKYNGRSTLNLTGKKMYVTQTLNKLVLAILIYFSGNISIQIKYITSQQKKITRAKEKNDKIIDLP